MAIKIFVFIFFLVCWLLSRTLNWYFFVFVLVQSVMKFLSDLENYTSEVSMLYLASNEKWELSLPLQPPEKTHAHTHIFHKTCQHQIISIIFKTLTLCYSSQHIMRPAPVCCPRQHGMVSANQKASLCIKALWLPVIKVSFPSRLSIMEVKCLCTSTFACMCWLALI